MDLLDAWEKHKQERLDVKRDSGAEIFIRREEVYGCSECRDRGFVVKKGKTKKCDNCLGIKKKDDVVELADVHVEEKMKELDIPNYYIGREFNPAILKNDENLDLEIRKDPLMEFYIHNLIKIHDYFVLGKKLDNSYLIMAPQGYSKSNLVYSCMQIALKKGFSVCPYYDTNELYKMYYKDDLKLEDVLSRDVCFIKIIPAFVSKKDTQAVKYILDKRSKRDLPTVVTSRFNMGYLSDIEPHLGNNFGLKVVEPGDYSKLKEVLGPYPKNYDKYSENKWNKK